MASKESTCCRILAAMLGGALAFGARAEGFLTQGDAQPEWIESDGERLISAPQYALWFEFTYGDNEGQVLDYAQPMIDNGLPPGA